MLENIWKFVAIAALFGLPVIFVIMRVVRESLYKVRRDAVLLALLDDTAPDRGMYDRIVERASGKLSGFGDRHRGNYVLLIRMMREQWICFRVTDGDGLLRWALTPKGALAASCLYHGHPIAS